MLSWLLKEPRSEVVRDALAAADLVVTSDLTLVECDRALIRTRRLAVLPEPEITRRQDVLRATIAHWTLLRLSPRVLERARQPFPDEPVRTLDALHLASALVAAATIEELSLLSMDSRLRSSARALGLSVAPAG